MFFTYLWNELRRRRRGGRRLARARRRDLAGRDGGGDGTGVRDAQSTVLGSLYGVGTDITVTREPQPGDGPQGFAFGQNGQQRVSRDIVTSSPGQGTFADERAAEVTTLDASRRRRRAEPDLDPHQRPAAELPDGGAAPPAGGGSTQQADPGQLNVDSSSIAGVDVTTRGVGPLSSVRISRRLPFAMRSACSSDNGNRKNETHE